MVISSLLFLPALSSYLHALCQLSWSLCCFFHLHFSPAVQALKDADPRSNSGTCLACLKINCNDVSMNTELN